MPAFPTSKHLVLLGYFQLPADNVELYPLLADKIAIKKTLIKYVPLMLRQVHRERNQKITVHPEPVEGAAQRIRKSAFRLAQKYLKLFPALVPQKRFGCIM